MELTLTHIQKFDLEVETKFPFEIRMEISYKRKETHWFTPTGILKINGKVIRCQHEYGRLGEGQYDAIIAKMKKAKSDLLVDNWGNYYTTGDHNLIRLPNVGDILEKAEQEYKARFRYYE